MLDKATVREIAHKYSEEVKKVFNPLSVILFGSYVNGSPHEWSDIDVAVLVDNVDDNDWYNARILLQDIRWDKNNGKAFIDVEPHLLNPNYDPSGFVEHVIKTGEIVYQA
jgi:predicted nucleotidyltransferase